MLDIEKMSVTDIQFFKYDCTVQINDEGDFEASSEYSANIIFDNKLVIQLSGNAEESHRPSIPSAAECYWNNEEAQDWACENLDIDDVIERLEGSEIENNIHFLEENATK
jgi:antirestriction protein